MKFTLFCSLITYALLAIPASAKDKDYIELTCGDTKASITCTKFSDDEHGKNICMASTLAFDTNDGKHIVASYKPPQLFMTPTIFDQLNCDVAKNGVFFNVWATPDCDYAECDNLSLFDQRGIRRAGSNKQWEKVLGPGKSVVGPSVSLRGDNNG